MDKTFLFPFHRELSYIRCSVIRNLQKDNYRFETKNGVKILSFKCSLLLTHKKDHNNKINMNNYLWKMS